MRRAREDPIRRGLGHPLHPILVHIPLVLLPASFVCDVVSLAGGADLRAAADWLLSAGLIAAVPTALAGLWDLWWHGALRVPRRKATLLHVSLVALALTGYVAA